jgi:hypothetical protein
MPAEIDFYGDTRGKFYRLGATVNRPLVLKMEVHSRLSRLANAKGRTPPPPSADLPRSCCSRWSASNACPKPSSASSCR